MPRRRVRRLREQKPDANLPDRPPIPFERQINSHAQRPSTSAEPLRELTARFPCFATRAPAAAATIAAAVEMLNVFEPSPPVPHVSTMFAGIASPSVNTRVACRRIMRANPASSCTSTGRLFSASSKRTISGVLTLLRAALPSPLLLPRV